MRFSKYYLTFLLIIVACFGLHFSSSDKPGEIVENYADSEETQPTQLMSALILPDVVRYGESLWDILRRHQVAKDEITLAIDEFKKMYDPRFIQAGDRYQLVQDSLNQLVAYFYQPEPATIYTIEKDGSEQFTCKVDTFSYSIKIKTLTGTISTTLYESIIEQGGNSELIIKFTDIFQWDVDFFVEPQRGDSYKIIYETYYLGDQFVKYGNILAAQYTLSGDVIHAFYYVTMQGKGGYYDWEGQSVQKMFLKSPLNYRRISSYFSLGRRHPILKYVRPHYGVDFVAPAGTPVVAPADGIVVETGYQSRGVGRYLKIRHSHSHFETLYGHLRAFAKGIHKGKYVKQRDVIGYVGSTGLATGSHLHYVFYENGRPINPLRIRNMSADPLHSDQIKRFRSTVLPHLEKLSGISDGNLAWLRIQHKSF